MSRTQRLALLGLAAVIAVVALIVLPGGDEENDTQPAAQTTASEQGTTAPETAPSTTATTTEPKPEPKPKPPLLRAGRERELEFEKGETVRFRVRHPTDEEIHVHGYDKSKAIKGGQTATMSFKANLEGIFEVELEHSGTPLGTIKVEPN